MSLLFKLRSAGFSVSLAGDQVLLSPSSKLTDQQLAYLKANKARLVDELIRELKQASRVSGSELACIAYTPLGEAVPVLARNPEHRHWVVVMNPPMTLQ